MSEQGSVWGRLKNAFVEDVPSAPDAPAPAPAPTQRNTPVPNQALQQRNTPLPPPPEEVDQAVRQKLEAAVDAGMPEALRSLRETSIMLSESIPDPEVAFKTAVKLSVKHGHKPEDLVGDVDVCVGILDKKKSEFEAAGQKTMRSAVEDRERRAVEINNEITEKNRLVNRLQSEVEKLAEEERQCVADAAAERHRIGVISRGFAGAYDSVRRNLDTLRSKLLASGGKA
jgi:hypothetical protein